MLALGNRTDDGHALYRRYGPALLRRCERILRDRDDAQDVVHNVFVDVLVKGRAGVGLGYLYRAATTRSLNVLRDRKRRDALLERHGLQLLVPRGERLEERVISMERVLALLGELDGVGGELFLYRYVDQMTQEEIAEVTGISRKTIGKRLAGLEARLEEWMP
jgi:RNA polymerase sigma-70 factor (ECF subfamily)